MKKLEREIQVGRPYRHFKGNLYYVHSIMVQSETRELEVCYQALYPPYGNFSRPLEMFASEVLPVGREDNATGQKYRFELFDGKLD